MVIIPRIVKNLDYIYSRFAFAANYFYEKSVKDCHRFFVVSWTPASAGVTIVTDGKEGLKYFSEKRKNVCNK
jgi:hypothetical protein